MTFIPNQLYFRSGANGSLHVLRWDPPYALTLFLRTKARTGGSLKVSLLEIAPDLPYGITGSTGPWHLVPEDIREEIFQYPPPDALTLAEMIRRNQRSHPPIKTLNGGLPWPVDTRDFGV